MSSLLVNSAPDVWANWSPDPGSSCSRRDCSSFRYCVMLDPALSPSPDANWNSGPNSRSTAVPPLPGALLPRNKPLIQAKKPPLLVDRARSVSVAMRLTTCATGEFSPDMTLSASRTSSLELNFVTLVSFKNCRHWAAYSVKYFSRSLLISVVCPLAVEPITQSSLLISPVALLNAFSMYSRYP